METNNKLAWAELRKQIATNTGIDQKEVARFMNALIPQLTEALRADKLVRLSGFGTFRLQSVAPRKSVDVNTKEAIILPGYNKVAFVPEIVLKENVSGNSETMPDPLKKLGEQADEIVGLLAELGQSVTKNGTQKDDAVPEEIEDAPSTDGISIAQENDEESLTDNIHATESDTKEEEQTLAIEEMEPENEEDISDTDEGKNIPTSTESATPEKIEEIPNTDGFSIVQENNEDLSVAKIPEIESGTIDGEQTSATKVDLPDMKEEKTIPTTNVGAESEKNDSTKAEEQGKKKKPFHAFRTAIITILCFLLILVGCYFFLQYKLTGWMENLRKKVTEPAEQVAEPADTVRVSADSDSCAIIDISDTDTEIEPVTSGGLMQEPRIYDEILTTESLPEGSRLAWLAKKYYGHKELWVFIYEANKDRIQSPSVIKQGTEIRIPKLPEEWTDLSNPELIELLDHLQQQYTY